jgi:hypothetical protein
LPRLRLSHQRRAPLFDSLHRILYPSFTLLLALTYCLLKTVVAVMGLPSAFVCGASTRMPVWSKNAILYEI